MLCVCVAGLGQEEGCSLCLWLTRSCFSERVRYRPTGQHDIGQDTNIGCSPGGEGFEEGEAGGGG